MLLSCCYHKTEHAQWQPLSKELGALLQACSQQCRAEERGDTEGGGETEQRETEQCVEEGISKFGLRLAAQETRHRYLATVLVEGVGDRS